LPALKKTVDWVTNADHGDGVIEMANQLIKDDLHLLDEKLEKHYLDFGQKFDGNEYKIGPYRAGILLAGESGGGKTTLTTFFSESLITNKYQFCLIDPEGDYTELNGTVNAGDAKNLPVIEEIVRLLKNPLQNVVVNTLAIPLHDRPEFFNKLLAALLELRKSFGHPHWFIFDEAHHLLPKGAASSFFNIPRDLNNFMLVTTEPELINPSIVSHTDLVIVIGKEPDNIFKQYAELRKIPMPDLAIKELNKGEVWTWETKKGEAFPVRIEKPVQLMQRHKKKYATGDMQDKSFYFRGPGKKLNLKANNLVLFIQMAEGVDDDTWMYHLGNKEYSEWFRNAVHDDELADFTEKIERTETDAARSKNAILTLIKEKYTAPA